MRRCGTKEMRKESEKREVKENLHKKAINDQLMMPNARCEEFSSGMAISS